MNKNYKFITIRELAEMLFSVGYNEAINFTLDETEGDLTNGEPTGWYGVKVVDMFDEPHGNICMGYYGGCATNMQSIYDETVDEYEEILQGMIDCERDVQSRAVTVCVEIK